jgi:uncharacterized protein (DUF362 family)
VAQINDPHFYKRREFLKGTFQAIAGAGITCAIGFGFWERRPRRLKLKLKKEKNSIRNYRVSLNSSAPHIIIAHGKNLSQLTQSIFKALGGIETFIKKGDTVAIKPNIGWDRIPIMAANTNPDLVGQIVKLCVRAGAKRVIVSDVACSEPRRAFERSGILKAAQSQGAEVIIPQKKDFKNASLGGEIIKEWEICAPLLEVDKFINIPVVKQHGLAGASLGMKNLYGILGGNRSRLHQSIHQSITDLARYIRPTLVILDAIRVLMRNGPQGGRISDTKRLDIIAAGMDQVAMDALGVTLLEQDPQDIGYLKLSHQRGLGNMHYKELNIVKIEA